MCYTSAIHFVGFRGDEYCRAIRVFGLPDFIHRNNDLRLYGDVAPGDTVVFANREDLKPVKKYAFNDSEHF